MKRRCDATRRRARRKRNMRGIKRGRTRQLRLPLAAAKTWGGARKGAGRKPRGRPSVPHVTRPRIDPRFPVQITIRGTRGLPSLRSPRVFGALRRAIARASLDRFRIIHFSIQQDHGHFIVEGDEARRARGGVHGLAIRLALAVNRALGRKGKVVGDRYHARPLTTPRQGADQVHRWRKQQTRHMGDVLLSRALEGRPCLGRRDHAWTCGENSSRDWPPASA
jgi:hypothetical protein